MSTVRRFVVTLALALVAGSGLLAGATAVSANLADGPQFQCPFC
jgi:hypothetical protein